jgi:hypothetical protein
VGKLAVKLARGFAPTVAPTIGESGQNLSLSGNRLGIVGIAEAARSVAVTTYFIGFWHEKRLIVIV